MQGLLSEVYIHHDHLRDGGGGDLITPDTLDHGDDLEDLSKRW